MYSKALLVAASLLWTTVLAAPAPDHRAHDNNNNVVVERDAQEPPAEDPILPSLLGPLLAPIPSLLAPIPSFLGSLLGGPLPTAAVTTRPVSLATSAPTPTRTAYTTLYSPFPAIPAVISALESIFATNPAVATASAIVIPVSALPTGLLSGSISAVPPTAPIVIPSARPTAIVPPSLVVPTIGLATVSLPSIVIPSARPTAIVPPSLVLPSLSLPSLSLPSPRLPSLSLPSLSLPSLSLPSLGLSLPSQVTGLLPTNITVSAPSLTTVVPSPSSISASVTAAISVAKPEDCPISYVTITQTDVQTLYVGHPLAPNATLTAPFITPLLNVTSLPLNLTLPLFTGTITGGPFPTINATSLPGIPTPLPPLPSSLVIPSLSIPAVPTVNATALLPTGFPNLTAIAPFPGGGSQLTPSPLPLLNITTRTLSSIHFSTLPIPTLSTVAPPPISLPVISLPTLSIPTLSIPTLSIPTLSIPTLSLPGFTLPTLALPTSLVIATTVSPISTAAFTSFPAVSATVSVTGAVGPAAPTGRPSTQNLHCGIHGAPLGDYYLATYAWNKRDVPVTLEGCYQFCNNVYGFTGGCQSFNFYLEPGLGAPRCDLYTGTVAFEVRSIDLQSGYTWFDLACGEPSQWIATK